MKRKPDKELAKGGTTELPMELGAETLEEKSARMVANGVAGNAFVTLMFSHPCGFLDAGNMQEIYTATKAAVAATKEGGTDQADSLLSSQAIALNALFVEMARRASINIGANLKATETYLRLALKAQSQCRTTLESLAEIRNPHPVAFVRQANIAAGHQQINNGRVQPIPAASDRRERISFAQNELLEGHVHGNWLESGAASETGGSHPSMEALDAVYRTDNGRGQAPVKP